MTFYISEKDNINIFNYFKMKTAHLSSTWYQLGGSSGAGESISKMVRSHG